MGHIRELWRLIPALLVLGWLAYLDNDLGWELGPVRFFFIGLFVGYLSSVITKLFVPFRFRK